MGILGPIIRLSGLTLFSRLLGLLRDVLFFASMSILTLASYSGADLEQEDAFGSTVKRGAGLDANQFLVTAT